MESIAVRPVIEIPRQALEAFCRRHHIAWLALFGSVLRDDCAPHSGIDVVVEFEAGQTPSLFGMMDLGAGRSTLLAGRPVDLGTKRSLSRWNKDKVLPDAMVVDDAARRSGLPRPHARRGTRGDRIIASHLGASREDGDLAAEPEIAVIAAVGVASAA